MKETLTGFNTSSDIVLLTCRARGRRRSLDMRRLDVLLVFQHREAECGLDRRLDSSSYIQYASEQCAYSQPSSSRTHLRPHHHLVLHVHPVIGACVSVGLGTTVERTLHHKRIMLPRPPQGDTVLSQRRLDIKPFGQEKDEHHNIAKAYRVACRCYLQYCKVV